MGLFESLFGSNKKQNTQAFGLFSFMEEQSKKESELEDEITFTNE